VSRSSRGRLEPLNSIQDEMNRLFDGFFGTEYRFPAMQTESHAGVMAPAIDISETEKAYRVKVEIPGVEPDHLNITTGDGYLTIEGEKKSESEENGENFLRRESSYGSFKRMVSLPEIADTDKAEASFKNGVLSISVPKREEAIKKEKKLSIKAA
jgi:HSP20 family protein